MMNYIIILFILVLLFVLGIVSVVHISQGWLWLTRGTDEFKVYFKTCKADWVTNPKISHYAGESGLFYNTKKQYWIWKFSDVLFTSHTDYSTFIDYMKDWFNSSYTMTMKIIRNTDGTSLIEWDGDNTSYTVALAKDGIKGVEKVAPENTDVYVIGMLVLEEV